MITALENGIADSMDESMRTYIESEDYQERRTSINHKLTCFRSGLTDAQKKEFNQLIDMIDDAHAEFSSKAFVCGAVSGMALHEQLLNP